MGRVLALDYGTKRTGIAVTDPLRIIATPLKTVPSGELISFLQQYIQTEEVDEFVVGLPKNLKNEDSALAPRVRALIRQLEVNFQGKKVTPVDERFTSQIAERAMIEGGVKKKARQNKANVDRLSATLILQSFLQSKGRQP